MKPRTKMAMATVLLLAAGALFAWYAAGGGRVERGLPSASPVDRIITLEQAPTAVQATTRREIAVGGIVEDIKEDRHRDGTTTYALDIIRGGMKIEIEIAPDGSVIERKSKKAKAKR